MAYLDLNFFARDTVTVAQDLIGSTLIVGKCAGRIVETEAYTKIGRASCRERVYVLV